MSGPRKFRVCTYYDTLLKRRQQSCCPIPEEFQSSLLIHKGAKTAMTRFSENFEANSPVRRAYELYNGLANRASWDQTAVLYAVRGLKGGLKDVWDLQTNGSIHFDAKNAYVEWRDQPQRDHAYLVEKMPPEQVARIIEALMRHLPAHSGHR